MLNYNNFSLSFPPPLFTEIVIKSWGKFSFSQKKTATIFFKTERERERQKKKTMMTSTLSAIISQDICYCLSPI